MNAILYARFSPRPDSSKTESIETQLERCRAFCVAHGHTVIEPAFIDRDASGGRADNRPGLQDAIDATCKYKAVLVCYSLSRLARNVDDARTILAKLRTRGAELALLDLSLDTTSPLGKCLFTILASVAELERAQVASRTSDAMVRHQAHGRRMSRRDKPPYGWRADPDDDARLIRDENEQRAIARIVQLRGESLGYRAIGRILIEEDGIPPRNSAKEWCHTTIRSILKRAGAK